MIVSHGLQHVDLLTWYEEGLRSCWKAPHRVGQLSGMPVRRAPAVSSSGQHQRPPSRHAWENSFSTLLKPEMNAEVGRILIVKTFVQKRLGRRSAWPLSLLKFVHLGYFNFFCKRSPAA